MDVITSPNLGSCLLIKGPQISQQPNRPSSSAVLSTKLVTFSFKCTESKWCVIYSCPDDVDQLERPILIITFQLLIAPFKTCTLLEMFNRYEMEMNTLIEHYNSKNPKPFPQNVTTCRWYFAFCRYTIVLRSYVDMFKEKHGISETTFSKCINFEENWH